MPAFGRAYTFKYADRFQFVDMILYRNNSNSSFFRYYFSAEIFIQVYQFQDFNSSFRQPFRQLIRQPFRQPLRQLICCYHRFG